MGVWRKFGVHQRKEDMRYGCLWENGISKFIKLVIKTKLFLFPSLPSILFDLFFKTFFIIHFN